MPIGTEGNEEVVEVLGELRDGFTEFKAASEAKLEAMRVELKKHEARSNREKLFGGAGERLSRVERSGMPAMPEEEHKALERALRTGDMRELKGMIESSGVAGGYTVPSSLAANIATLATAFNPMRQLAQVLDVSGDFALPVCTSGVGAEWRGEGSTRAETASPTFALVRPPKGELSAVVKISQELLQDSAFDLTAFLVQEAARSFAVTEGAAFINGVLANRPAGIFAQPMAETADATRPFFTIEWVKSGSAASVADATGGAAGLINLLHSLKPEYRRNSTWLASPGAIREIRLLEDANGNALWAESLSAGDPPTLLGRPLLECADLAEPGAGAFPVLLADWKRAYVVTDLIGSARMVVDPYTSKGNLIVEIARRVGGATLDSCAIKALKCAA